MFQIRLDRLVDKWSGSIEVGITTHNPNSIDFPATMTNMRSGNYLLQYISSEDRPRHEKQVFRVCNQVRLSY